MSHENTPKAPESIHNIDVIDESEGKILIPVEQSMGAHAINVTAVEYPEGAGGALIDEHGNRVLEMPSGEDHSESEYEA